MTSDTRIPTRRIGMVDVAVVDIEQALSIAAQAVADGAPCMIGFANAHTVNTACKNNAFRAALSRALILNDGVGVDLASRLLYGEPFPSNLNGTDFTPALLDRLPAGTRLFLLGGRPGIGERAAAAIKARHGHIEIAGMRNGFFATAEERAIRETIRTSRAQVVLVAMGHPRQELWADENADHLDATVMCVGALLDFYSGAAIRAPEWVRRIRLEWAYRLLREPRRLAGRYLIGNFVFLASILSTHRKQDSLLQSSVRRHANVADRPN